MSHPYIPIRVTEVSMAANYLKIAKETLKFNRIIYNLRLENQNEESIFPYC